MALAVVNGAGHEMSRGRATGRKTWVKAALLAALAALKEQLDAEGVSLNYVKVEV